jgi:Zn-dependent peptidase ImmA (M78 family)
MVAGEVLRRYAQVAEWEPSLPVPVDLIIERCYGLMIEWQVLDEEPGDVILGALDPKAKTIVLNETHADTVLAHVGPTSFTFAHELGHWVYDAVPPEQGQLFDAAAETFCRGAADVDPVTRIREVNANKFAAALLMPEGLVRECLPESLTYSVVGALARQWGVSRRALEIRLETLGYFGDQLPGELSLGGG